MRIRSCDPSDVALIGAIVNRLVHGQIAAAIVGVALLAAACSDGRSSTTSEAEGQPGSTQDPVTAAEERVAQAEAARAAAQDALGSAHAQFCSETTEYITAIERYGKVFTDAAATVGDVKSGGTDLAQPRESVAAAMDAVSAAQDDLASA